MNTCMMWFRRNTYMAFPCFWHRAPERLGVSSDELLPCLLELPKGRSFLLGEPANEWRVAISVPDLWGAGGGSGG